MTDSTPARIVGAPEFTPQTSRTPAEIAAEILHRPSDPQEPRLPAPPLASTESATYAGLTSAARAPFQNDARNLGALTDEEIELVAAELYAQHLENIAAVQAADAHEGDGMANAFALVDRIRARR